MEHDEYKRLNEELESFYNAIPRNVELLSVQDIHANIHVRSKIFSDVIGIHGLDNRNAKGKDLLFLFKVLNL